MSVRAWQAAWAAALLAAPAMAGSLRVDPVQVVISEDRQTAAVTVTNRQDAPVTVHLYPLAWTQSDGEDVYSETSAVIVSPRVVTIPSYGTQLVRVGFRNQATANGAWRLMIEEVPQSDSEETGVRVALRMNLPLFARLNAGKPADLRWSAWRNPDGGWTLEALNESTSFVRLQPADLIASTGIEHEPSLRLGVVLPNSRRRWRIAGRPALIDDARFQRITRAEGSHGLTAVASARD